jgi:hypothetical protein
MKIIATIHNPLPPSIHIRHYDWVAFYDDGPDNALAFGPTERAAIEELVQRFPYTQE